VLDEKGAGLRLSELNPLKSAALGLSLFFALRQQGEELTNLWSALQSIDRPWQPTGRMLTHRIVWPQLPDAKNNCHHWVAAKLD
jgi:hypothetical protein